MIIILKHVPEEGPGSIEQYLSEHSLPYRIFETINLEEPHFHSDIRAVVLMGGPMGVYEREHYPQLQISLRVIERALRANVPILGICLGSQLLAHALGAKVYKGQEEEIGWREIKLTHEGMEDPAMQALARNPFTENRDRTFTVFHWHGDTFELPKGSVHLASSDLYPNQAFRYERKVYAFQFHVEVTEAMIREWFQQDPLASRMRRETQARIGEYARRAEQFYRYFFNLKTINREVAMY
ncbi:MAG: type 1 glutamine amidotransferase [Spirochaetes bacterium]|nr:type 1 glutamine amidotransferase [Spirochaetota bacterium]